MEGDWQSMINFHVRWLKVQFIDCFRRLSFYLFSFLFLLGFTLVFSIFKEYNQETEVLLYTMESSIGGKVSASLVEKQPDGFSFIAIDDVNELRDEIKRGEASCGVIFEDRDRLCDVTIVQPQNSVDGYVIKEMIYPLIRRAVAKQWLEEYLKKVELNQSDIDYIQSRYDEYLDADNLSIYRVEVLGDNQAVLTSDEIMAKTLLNRNKKIMFCCIVLVLVCFLICAIDVWKSDIGFYRVFSKNTRVILRLEKCILEVALALIPAVVWGLCLMHIGG